jgi:hypothetical protein
MTGQSVAPCQAGAEWAYSRMVGISPLDLTYKTRS